MKNKRIILILLVMMSVFALVCGCGEVKEVEEKKDQNAWAKEAAKNVPEEIDVENGGQIYIKDHLYQFPMKASDFLDNGWHYSKNYVDLEGSTVDPKYEVQALELFHDEDSDDYIQITVYNPGDETISIDDALVTEVYCGSCSEVAVSGGIYVDQPEKDMLKVVEALGDDAFKQVDKDLQDSYDYYIPFRSGDYSCAIIIGVVTAGDPYVCSVDMAFLDDDNNFFTIEDNADYVRACMENDYHNDSNDLVNKYYVGVSDASESHRYTQEYIAEAIYQYAGLEAESGELIIMEGVVATLLSDATWDVQEENGEIVINITYPNTVDLITAAYESASAQDGDMATKFTTYMKEHAGDRTYGNTTTVRYTIDEDYVISGDDSAELALIVAGLIQQQN